MASGGFRVWLSEKTAGWLCDDHGVRPAAAPWPLSSPHGRRSASDWPARRVADSQPCLTAQRPTALRPPSRLSPQHLYTALDVNLDETIDKHSAILEREASYSKRSRLARLPPILAVQFVRFAYRKDTGKRAKILRNVSFPPMLDVRNLCTKDLQVRLQIAPDCSRLLQIASDCY